MVHFERSKNSTQVISGNEQYEFKPNRKERRDAQFKRRHYKKMRNEVKKYGAKATTD